MPQVHKMAKFTTWATCLQAIVDTLVAAGWELSYDFRAQNPATIANSTAYTLGQMVFAGVAGNNGMVYVCTTAGTTASNAATAFAGAQLVNTANGTAGFFGVSRQSVIMRTRQASNRPWVYVYIGALEATNAYAIMTCVMMAGYDFAAGSNIFFGRTYANMHTGYGRTVFQAAGTYYTDIFADQYAFYIQLADTSAPSTPQRAIAVVLPEIELITDTVTVTAPATAGSSVTVAVSDSSQFIPNKSYRYISPDGKIREKVTISSIPTSTSIVITTLRNNIPTGSYFGSFPFCGVQSRTNTPSLDCIHIWDNSVNTDVNTSGEAPSDGNAMVYPTRHSGVANVAGNYFNSQSAISRVLLHINTPIVPLGILSDLFMFLDFGTCGDQFGINEFYRGSVGAATATTVTDSNASWAVDSLVGKRVVLTTGTGSGQSRKIISNTATTITIDSGCPWETLPVNGTSYSLVLSSYRRCRTVGFSSSLAMKELN